jgi:hypothetical protein
VDDSGEVKTTLRCRVCGSEIRVYANYARKGKGKYCSRACKAKGGAEERFRAQHGGRSPAEVARYLLSNRLTLSAYAVESGIPLGTLYGHVQRFGIEPYRPPLKERAEFACQQCGGTFFGYDRPSRFGRNRFCGTECKKIAGRKRFDERAFRTVALVFASPDATLGSYSTVQMGSRQRSFVNRGKFNHFFFSDGITDEVRAYVFGMLLTDGSVFRGAKGSYYLRLELIDHDIIHKVAAAICYRGRLYGNPKRRTLTLSVARTCTMTSLPWGAVPERRRPQGIPGLSANGSPPHSGDHRRRRIVGATRSEGVIAAGVWE